MGTGSAQLAKELMLVKVGAGGVITRADVLAATEAASEVGRVAGPGVRADA